MSPGEELRRRGGGLVSDDAGWLLTVVDERWLLTVVDEADRVP
jgi:hypothetical protein